MEQYSPRNTIQFEGISAEEPEDKARRVIKPVSNVSIL
jgi:hypothetical protein